MTLLQLIDKVQRCGGYYYNRLQDPKVKLIMRLTEIFEQFRHLEDEQREDVIEDLLFELAPKAKDKDAEDLKQISKYEENIKALRQRIAFRQRCRAKREERVKRLKQQTEEVVS